MFINSCFSQKSVKYEYVISNCPIVSKPYLGMELEFSTNRVYENDSVFKESRLFTGSHEDYILFKKKDEIWYYKNKGKWNLFYNYKNKKGGRIRVSNVDYKLVFDKKIILRGITLHKIHLKSSKLIQTHQPYYYFDYEEGVLIMKTSLMKMLIRKDFFENPLSKQEEELL